MKYIIDTQAAVPFFHYWETCIGSCHGTTTLRADWREQLKTVHDELGFTYVRFHGLLDDDMSVVLCDSPSPYMPSDKVKYNFMNIDNTFDYLVSIGMKPFIELGFMPRLLASGGQTTMAFAANITPPKEYALWGEFMEAFVRHLTDRYGTEEVSTWFFEVWNEPNLDSFWTGGQDGYFKLYETTARAVKKVNAGYRIGGPATSINAWIPELRDYCAKNDVPLDFISTHHYPTDDPMWNNPDMDLMSILSEKGMDAMSKYDKHIMRRMTERAKEQAGELPLYYTEWNVSAMMGDAVHDKPYAAACAARIIHENAGLVDGYSWWTFSDIFEEMGQMLGEFAGGFGLMTYHGIKKPVYQVFSLLHRLGKEQCEVTVSESDVNSTDNVGVLASKESDSVRILAYNHNTEALNDIKEETITLHIKGYSGGNARIMRIDEEHADPYALYMKMGSPDYVDAGQLDELKKASLLEIQTIAAEPAEDGCDITLTLPPYGVAYVEMDKKAC